jgi:Fe2+ or Zn2+ uptake regulation protein
MRDPAELTVAFRRQGLRVTPQRQLLFRLLHDNATHPSAEALFAVASATMPGISLRTVYQTLSDLAGLGEIQQLDVGTGSARFDPNTGDHHHLVCSQCGQVRDVQLEDAAVLRPHGELDGFEIADTQVVFRGTCAACHRAAATVASSQRHPADHQSKGVNDA